MRVEPKNVDPQVIKTMVEIGIDFSAQDTKDTNSLGDMDFDYVVTLCDNTHESCPFYPIKIRVIHKGLVDPAQLAEKAKTNEEILSLYGRVRDEIKAFVMGLPEGIEES